MSEGSRFDALFLAPGTGLHYFSGFVCASERLLALIIPRTGDRSSFARLIEEGRMRDA